MTISQTNHGQLLPADEGIVRIDDTRREEAVQHLVGSGSRGGRHLARRFITFAREQRIDLQWMWSRLDGRGGVAGTVLIVPSPGRTAMVFASPAEDDPAVSSMAALVDHACIAMAALTGPPGPIRVAQVLLDHGSARQRRMFHGGGFRDLSRLSYLERSLPGPAIAQSRQPPPEVRLQPYRPTERRMLLEILEASYEQTLDCPGLLGLRRTEEILTGHMSTGRFDPSLWTMLHLDGRPAGALLLNPALQDRTVELVYLGLAAFARGRGLGELLLHHGLRQLLARHDRVVTLAVDDQNTPAVNLYLRNGFRRVLRRLALIRCLTEHDTRSAHDH